MHEGAQNFLRLWQSVVDDRDAKGIEQLLADDISMGAPPYWNRIDGKETVGYLLGIISETIVNFTYHRTWVDERELALEFTGQVGDCELQGIDLITIDDTGLITRLDVMIRPENALAALRECVAPRMLEFFERRNE